MNPEKCTNPEKTENSWYVFWKFSKLVLSFGSQQGKNGSMMRKTPKFSACGGQYSHFYYLFVCYYEKSPPVRAAKILRALFSGFVENLKINTVWKPVFFKGFAKSKKKIGRLRRPLKSKKKSAPSAPKSKKKQIHKK